MLGEKPVVNTYVVIIFKHYICDWQVDFQHAGHPSMVTKPVATAAGCDGLRSGPKALPSKAKVLRPLSQPSAAATEDLRCKAPLC